MSVKLVFSVFDSKAEAYLPPFYATTRGVAQRMFIAAACDPQHDFHRFAEDYTLFELGEFDERTGDFRLHAAKQSLGCAITYVRLQEDVQDEEKE